MQFNLKGGMPGMPQVPPQMPTLLMVLGGAAFAFGLLLLWNEWLLRWIVAGVFLLLGSMLLLAGLRAKRLMG